MSVKIGIPRAMMFYRYYPLWSTFFRELGVEVVVSPSTSKRLVDRGVINAPEDTCLPVKVARDWEVELSGTNEVFTFAMAQSMEELKSV